MYINKDLKNCDIMKKSIEWVKRMEIKIEETEDTLKIIKSCRQELK